MPRTSKKARRAEAAFPAILPLTNDFVFKGVFGVRECAASLTAFLAALCPWLAAEDFGEIAFPDTRRKRRHRDDKESVLDVCVTLKSGRMIALEIQMLPFPGLCDRAQFYNAKMMVETLGKGMAYADLPEVITVFILGGGRLFGGPGYRHEYRMLDVATGAGLPNSQVLLFVELPKLPEESDGTALWLWLRLFGATTRDEMEAFVGKEPAMAEAAARILEMSADKRARLRAISREKWRRDREAVLHEAETALDRGRAVGRAEGRTEGREEGRTEGRTEGRAEGRTEERRAVARSMLRMKMPLADIARATGLSETEVKGLAKR